MFGCLGPSSVFPYVADQISLGPLPPSRSRSPPNSYLPPDDGAPYYSRVGPAGPGVVYVAPGNGAEAAPGLVTYDDADNMYSSQAKADYAAIDPRFSRPGADASQVPAT